MWNVLLDLELGSCESKKCASGQSRFPSTLKQKGAPSHTMKSDDPRTIKMHNIFSRDEEAAKERPRDDFSSWM
jgi:hypothetical protein